jgi:hypothetical protein
MMMNITVLSTNLPYFSCAVCVANCGQSEYCVAVFVRADLIQAGHPPILLLSIATGEFQYPHMLSDRAFRAHITQEEFSG